MVVNVATKLPGGYTTDLTGTFAGDVLPIPNFGEHVTWFDDFLWLALGGSGVAEYTAHQVGGGATALILDADDQPSGAVRLTTTSGDNGEIAIQLNSTAFQFVDGKNLWFEARVRVQTLVPSAYLVGLQTTEALINTRTGVTVGKTQSGNGDVYQVFLDGAGLTDIETSGRIVANEWAKVAYHWDGANLQVYLDDIFLVTVSGNDGNFLKNTLVAPIFALERGNPTTQTADIDYMFVVAER
ncbi:MAG: hypothetical protein ACR2PR_08685 [Pseudohongiellaceae bacterium]